jgi:transposase InsO family protein
VDFIVGLLRTAKGYDSIWVIVDRLTKIAHFLPIRVKYTMATYAELYIGRILSLHGLPKTIVSDRGHQFVAKFWEALHQSLDTKLLHSSVYHPQTSGQTERVNQIFEDMLRACALEFPQKWDDCLPLAEFSYNNIYQESIKVAPFETLYGRRCRTPLNWSEPGERSFFRLDMVKETEEKGSTNDTSFEESSSSSEELCRQATTTLVLSRGRLCLPESFTDEGCITFWG